MATVPVSPAKLLLHRTIRVRCGRQTELARVSATGHVGIKRDIPVLKIEPLDGGPSVWINDTQVLEVQG